MLVGAAPDSAEVRVARQKPLVQSCTASGDSTARCNTFVALQVNSLAMYIGCVLWMTCGTCHLGLLLRGCLPPSYIAYCATWQYVALGMLLAHVDGLMMQMLGPIVFYQHAATKRPNGRTLMADFVERVERVGKNGDCVQ